MPEWILFVCIPLFIGSFVFLVGLYVFLIRGVSYKEEASLFGKTAIVTGGNNGIGKEVVRDLANRRARVIIACRNKERAFKTIKEIAEQTRSTLLDYVYLDLADLNSVRQFAATILKNEQRLDILVNNTEIGYARSGSTTKQGFHLRFGVNHFGHFLLTNLLLPLLKVNKETPGRIVIISSIANTWVSGPLDFTPGGENGIQYPNLSYYPASKLANFLHAMALAKRLQGSGVNVYTVLPGLITTNMLEDGKNALGKWGQLFIRLLLRCCSQSPRMGAQTIIYCAAEPTLVGMTGKFYFNCDEARSVFQSRLATDDAAEKLWEVSCLATQSTIETYM